MELNFFYDHIIIIPILSYLIVVVLKIFFSKQKGDTNLHKIFLGSGGMPSAHTAIFSSLTAAFLLKHGFQSDFFALSFAFLMIITYDAISIRYDAGLHAGEINKLIGEKKYNELLGHRPSEALVGILLGIVIALALYYI